MVSSPHRCLGLVAAIALIVPTLAHAQDKDELALAKKRFNEARAKLDGGKHLEAAALFLEAYELSKRPELLYNVAQAYRLGGDVLNAQRYYKRYLDELPGASNAEEVLEHIIALQQEIKQKFARVQVDSGDVEGQDVFVADEAEARCQTPCTLTLEPGRYKLRVASRGPAREINAEAGQTLNASFAQAPIPRGKLQLAADVPNATATLDNRTIALPMREPVELVAKRWPVTVQAGEFTWRGELDVQDGQTLNLLVGLNQERPEEGTNLRRVGAYTLWGTGAAFLIGGLLMGSQASDTFSNLEAQRSRGVVDRSLVEQGSSQQFYANTLIVTSVITLLAGTGLFVWDVLDSGDKADVAPPSAPTADEPSEDDLL